MTSTFKSINTIFIILFLSLIGCGSSNDSELSSNLVSTFPADKSIGISVNTNLVLTYGQDVTQSDLDGLELSLSVSPENIEKFVPDLQIRYVTEQDVFKAKAISFSATIQDNRVIITPSAYLESETLYQLSFGSNAISFKTMKNKPKRMVKSFGTFEQAETDYYNEFEYSENKVTNTRYTSAGSDETWFTEDDGLNQFTVDELDDKERILLTYYFTNSWLGGFGNPNFSSVTTYQRSELGLVEQSNYYGYSIPYEYPHTPSSDELPNSYNLYSRGNGYLEVSTFGQFGDDQVWFTFDDALTQKMRISFNTDGQVIGHLTTGYREGPDQEWDTADDEINYQAKKADYDSDGLLLKTYNLTGVGEDNTWFTEDDLIESARTYIYENGLLKSIRIHSAAGVDETWGTADDEVIYVHEFEHNTNGQYTSRKIISAGEDLTLGTQDDVEVVVEYNEYNDAGLMTNSRSIIFSGSFNSEQFYIFDTEYQLEQ